MTSPQPLTTPALQALLEDATLAGTWVLDPATSAVGLTTRHTWGLAPLSGAFRQVEGEGTVAPDGQVSGTLTIAAASIDTKSKRRDADLRSAKLFDVGTYPDITFTLDRITPGTGGVTVAGRLTVRDRTRPVSFPAQVSVPASGEVWLDGEIQVNRADFGLTYNPLRMASLKNTITVHAVFSKR